MNSSCGMILCPFSVASSAYMVKSVQSRRSSAVLTDAAPPNPCCHGLESKRVPLSTHFTTLWVGDRPAPFLACFSLPLLRTMSLLVVCCVVWFCVLLSSSKRNITRQYFSLKISYLPCLQQVSVLCVVRTPLVSVSVCSAARF